MLKNNVDPVTVQVVNNFLITAAREMGIAMKNTAYSTLFNEGLDFSCALFDENAHMIAQAEFCPAQLGAISYILKVTVDEIGKDNLKPGDVVAHNDPFRGGCHLPEFTVIKPIFYDSILVGYACNIGHMSEIGGKTAGGMAGDATEVFQEGLRLPPVKIIEDGQDSEDIWNIILANVRTPRITYGDLKAMIGSLSIGETRLIEIIKKHGLKRFREIRDAIFEYSERRMRAEIREIPDGEYFYEGYAADNDGIVDERVPMRVEIKKYADEMIVDYSKSPKQTKGPINCTYGVTASATFNALMQITDHTIPTNYGSFKPITIIAKPGTIFNVQWPGSSVAGNCEIHPHIVSAIMCALAPVIPDRIAAPDGGASCMHSYAGIRSDLNEVFLNTTNEPAGWGGRHNKDGNNSLCIPNGNCALTPVEILETRYPILVERLSLYENSGGPGEFRGGLGIVREVRVLEEEMNLSMLLERAEVNPEGIFGGKPGKTGDFLIKRTGSKEFKKAKEIFNLACNGKFSGIILHKGDVWRLKMPGGGGYGDPKERDLEKIKEDILEGYVSKAVAEKEYYVVFKENSEELEIDIEKTKQLRAGK